MDIKKQLLELMQENNISIEEIAQKTHIPVKKLQKRFDEDKIRYLDVIEILDYLGYKIVYKKKFI